MSSVRNKVTLETREPVGSIYSGAMVALFFILTSFKFALQNQGQKGSNCPGQGENPDHLSLSHGYGRGDLNKQKTTHNNDS